jgi:hypothetical protein
MTKINLDPQAAAKLQKVRMKHKERLEELKIEKAEVALDETKAHLADTQSARQREIAGVQATGKSRISILILFHRVSLFKLKYIQRVNPAD